MPASTPETIQIGDRLLCRELVDRKKLSAQGFKIPNAVVYERAWVVRQAADGPDGPALRYFLDRDEALRWLEEPSADPNEAESDTGAQADGAEGKAGDTGAQAQGAGIQTGDAGGEKPPAAAPKETEG